jgi:hypothetical protein
VTSIATLRVSGQVDSWLKMFGVPKALAKVSRKASPALVLLPDGGQPVADVAVRLIPARLAELALATLALPDERGADPVGILQQGDAGVALGADRTLGRLLLGVPLDPDHLAVADPDQDRAAHGAHLADAGHHGLGPRCLCGLGGLW